MGVFDKPPYFFSRLRAGWQSLMAIFIESLRRLMWRFTQFVQMPAWWEEHGPGLIVIIFGVLDMLYIAYIRRSPSDTYRAMGAFLITFVLNILILWWMYNKKFTYTASSISFFWAGMFVLAHAIAFMFF